MDHLVVRARLGHRGGPGGHVGARDDALAGDQHRPSGLLAPAVETDLRPLGEAHEVRVDVSEAEDPGRAGRTLAHDRAGLVALDLVSGIEEGGRGGHADDTGPDHCDPHPREASQCNSASTTSRGSGADEGSGSYTHRSDAEPGSRCKSDTVLATVTRELAPNSPLDRTVREGRGAAPDLGVRRPPASVL